jgi:hypothetical protein
MYKDAQSSRYAQKPRHVSLKPSGKSERDCVRADGDARFTDDVVEPGEFESPAKVDTFDLQLADGCLDRGDSLAVEVEVG